jgi:hypothetical protein
METKMKTIQNIQPKPYKKFGTTYHPEEKNIYHADIIPKKSIRLYGTYLNNVNGPVDFDKTFNIGDQAEYDSYNLNYTGEIVAITLKTVTIADQYESRRLDLHTFAWRNWDFDAQRIFEANCDTLQRI